MMRFPLSVLLHKRCKVGKKVVRGEILKKTLA